MTTLPVPRQATSQALQALKKSAIELSIVADRAQDTADQIPTLLTDFTNRNCMKAADHATYLWQMAQHTGSFQDPPADYAGRVATREIELLRDRKHRQDPVFIARSANRAIALMARLLARALEAPGYEPPETDDAETPTRYPVIIRPRKDAETAWQDDLQRSGAANLGVFVIGPMTKEQHRQLAGHNHITYDLAYLRSNQEGPTVLDLQMAHDEASTMAEAWKVQTDEEWQPVPMMELDLDAALQLINTVNSVLNSDLDVAYEMFDDDFIEQHREAWVKFMRPVAPVQNPD